MSENRPALAVAAMDSLYSEGDALYYWRLCDELSVVQAALLIVGKDPAQFERQVHSFENRPIGFDAAKTALVNAIERKRLPATIVDRDYPEFEGDVDWYRTTVTVEDVRGWLRSRGIGTGFFFPALEVGPEYMSVSHPNYSPKLAAAITAWSAVSADEQLRRGKTVKQALQIWLRQHANEFGLTKEDGNPNEQGIDDVAKIANWDTRGGAPKTPGNE
jgi:hypothetical protein